MNDAGLTVPIHVMTGLLAPTLAEMQSGIDLHGWMRREAAKTPEERAADLKAYRLREVEEQEARIERWQRVADVWPQPGVRAILDMHRPDGRYCGGHEEEPWPCPEFLALEADEPG